MTSINLNHLESSVNKATMHFHLEEGIKKVWEEDSEFQTIALNTVIKEIRGLSGEDADAMFNYLKDVGAIYIPGDEYLPAFFNHIILKNEFGLYRNGYCTLAGRLAIPLRYLDDTLFGFVGYDNGNTLESKDDLVKYLYPPKHVFQKEKYMYIGREEMLKSIEDGYVFIVDGIFDKIKLQSMGFNAVSLCGSALTKWHIMYLSTIKNKIVLPDNDSAGIVLSRRCQRVLSNCIEFKQGQDDDVHDWTRTEEGKKLFVELFNQSKEEGFLLNKVIRKPVSNKKRGNTYEQ